MTYMQIATTLTPDQKKLLEDLVWAKRMTLSRYIREAVLDAMKRDQSGAK